ncbi:MAG: helix-turn-helix transcriptional regulator [Thermoleophilia bacterium]
MSKTVTHRTGGEDAQKAASSTKGRASRGRRLVLPAVLLTLAEGESHGYEIAGRLLDQGFLSRPDTAIVYRTLAALEADGLVDSTVRDGTGGPRRTMYSLTEAGRLELDDWADLIAERVRTLGGFLQRYRALT